MIAVFAGAENTPMLVVGTVVLYLGIAPSITLATDVIVSAAPPERAGSASSLSETGIELGGAMGIAVLGSIGIGVYRDQLDGSIPSAVPEGAAQGAIDTLGGAVDAARDLPSGLSGELLDAAHAAFADGMTVVSLVGAGLMATLAVIALTALRNAGVRAPEVETTDQSS